MCGIVGGYRFTTNANFSKEHVEKALQKLSQRGPDASGLMEESRVILGHTRLSILDTSTHANQPMKTPSGRYTLVFNGEIYNFRELKKTLENKGIAFQTSSDTEVLLYGLIEEGKQFLQKLNGFFAFAFYDHHEEKILIARDRYGIKPLYFRKTEKELLFGSELKALMEFPFERELNPEAMHSYFQLNYIPAPLTILEGVQKLEPGQLMEANTSGFTMRHWYELPQVEHYENSSYEAQQKKLNSLLEEAVQKRLVADVPLGCFLSGGIDSSVITALASKSVDRLNTFSIGYSDAPYFDETNYAQLVAKKYNTNHTVFSLTQKDLFSHLDETLAYIDEPFADSSALPVYILSKMTRKEVTVSLSGDGADEVFSGYNKHKAEYLMRQGGVRNKVVKLLSPLWKALPKSRNNPLTNKFRQLNRFAEGARLSPAARYWRWCSFAVDKDVDNLLTTTSKTDLRHIKQQYTSSITGEDFNEVLRADVALVLQNDMLVKVDRMSMANSLEVRVPFLDHEVVEYAFSLDASSKIDGAMKKKIVQDAFRNLLPAELYNRPKHGFEVPLLDWLRTDLKSRIDNDWLNEQFLEEQQIFNLDEIRKLKAQLFSSNPEDSHARLWAIIVFQHWWKKYMN